MINALRLRLRLEAFIEPFTKQMSMTFQIRQEGIRAQIGTQLVERHAGMPLRAESTSQLLTSRTNAHTSSALGRT
jgi:hypothetical protein